MQGYRSAGNGARSLPAWIPEVTCSTAGLRLGWGGGMGPGGRGIGKGWESSGGRNGGSLYRSVNSRGTMSGGGRFCS